LFDLRCQRRLAVVLGHLQRPQRAP
jgi:hypothetical protein